MKRILLASVAALGLAGTASAADLAVKAPVVYAPAFTWTGCYLGINGGWIGGRDSYTTEASGRWLTGIDPAGAAFNVATLGELRNSYSSDEGAGTAGGQFGCQVQWGSIVLGGEWDGNYSGLAEDNYYQFPATANWNSRSEWTHKELDWFTTFRVRLGLAWDRVLIYATGGFAVGAYDSYTQISFPANTVPLYFGAYRESRIGYTVGGGIEWAFANNWTAKAEFLYLDFGSFDYWSPRTSDGRYWWNTRIDTEEYVARIGINYLFHLGGAPVVAKY
jgi:outer membrane immunogenic protein